MSRASKLAAASGTILVGRYRVAGAIASINNHDDDDDAKETHHCTKAKENLASNQSAKGPVLQPRRRRARRQLRHKLTHLHKSKRGKKRVHVAGASLLVSTPHTQPQRYVRSSVHAQRRYRWRPQPQPATARVPSHTTRVTAPASYMPPCWRGTLSTRIGDYHHSTSSGSCFRKITSGDTRVRGERVTAVTRLGYADQSRDVTTSAC